MWNIRLLMIPPPTPVEENRGNIRELTTLVKDQSEVRHRGCCSLESPRLLMWSLKPTEPNLLADTETDGLLSGEVSLLWGRQTWLVLLASKPEECAEQTWSPEQSHSSK